MKTLRLVKATIHGMGMSVQWNSDTREFRVNFPGGAEATAYYTNDADDAIGTAKAMSDSRTP